MFHIPDKNSNQSKFENGRKMRYTDHWHLDMYGMFHDTKFIPLNSTNLEKTNFWLACRSAEIISSSYKSKHIARNFRWNRHHNNCKYGPYERKKLKDM